MVKRINKKAWLRITEAFIAVLIILGVIITIVMNNSSKTDVGKTIYDKEKYILEIISKNETLRKEIIENTDLTAGESENEIINNTISGMIPSSWEFRTKICKIDEICQGRDIPNDKEIYSSEKILSATISSYEPRKIVLFVWLK